MEAIIIDKEIVNLIKKEISTISTEELNDIVSDSFENSYEFILCDSIDCTLDEVPNILRNRLIKENSKHFIDSDLKFSDLTEAIEHFLYNVSIRIVEEHANNYLEDDDNYDIEDNELYIDLMNIYDASINWCSFDFNRDEDKLTIITHNFLNFEMQIDFEIARMNEKEYVCDVLIAKLKEVLV